MKPTKKANQSQEDTDIENRRYDTTVERPPRLDLRRDSAPVRDPELHKEKIERRDDLGGTSVYQKKTSPKKGAKEQDDAAQGASSGRNLSGFKPKKENLVKLLQVEAKLDVCLKFMSQAMSEFYALKSSDISPDGKLGGRGFVMDIVDIRARLYSAVENVSGLIDTLYDETHGDHWASDCFPQPEIPQQELPPTDSAQEGAEDFSKVSNILSYVKKRAGLKE